MQRDMVGNSFRCLETLGFGELALEGKATNRTAELWGWRIETCCLWHCHVAGSLHPLRSKYFCLLVLNLLSVFPEAL